MLPANPRHAGEAGQRVERDVHLAGRTAELEAADVADEFVRQLLRIEELEERTARIEARHDDRCLELIAVLEHDTAGASVADEDLGNTGIAPDLGAKRARRRRDRLAHGAGAALGKAPGAEYPVQLAHVMMKQDVSGPRRARPQKRADDPARR